MFSLTSEVSEAEQCATFFSNKKAPGISGAYKNAFKSII
jgi:hypothetical protein